MPAGARATEIAIAVNLADAETIGDEPLMELVPVEAGTPMDCFAGAVATFGSTPAESARLLMRKPGLGPRGFFALTAFFPGAAESALQAELGFGQHVGARASLPIAHPYFVAWTREASAWPGFLEQALRGRSEERFPAVVRLRQIMSGWQDILAHLQAAVETARAELVNRQRTAKPPAWEDAVAAVWRRRKPAPWERDWIGERLLNVWGAFGFVLVFGCPILSLHNCLETPGETSAIVAAFFTALVAGIAFGTVVAMAFAAWGLAPYVFWLLVSLVEATVTEYPEMRRRAAGVAVTVRGGHDGLLRAERELSLALGRSQQGG